jgi:hypothetical protein
LGSNTNIGLYIPYFPSYLSPFLSQVYGG